MYPLLETEFIVLKKTPYSDHAMVLGGISGEYGRLSLMVRSSGAMKFGPSMDLFRLVHLSFTPGRESLATVNEAELLEDFGGLTREYSSYQTAAWISSFAMSNTMPMLGHPLFANAVEVGLRRLVNRVLPVDAIKTCVAIAFIFEEGWLAHTLQEPSGAAQCRQLLEMAAGKSGPILSNECWRKQYQWCRYILLNNECKVPEE